CARHGYDGYFPGYFDVW
nr:immunoglobulin heavy chain junction region [Mus musculus]MBK4186836.1 immunoglobulin heavy chain junction region [Mus musculus]